MSSFFHKIGAILGPVTVLLPSFGLIPGAGKVVNGALVVTGVLTTLIANLEKAFGGGGPAAE